MLFRSGYKRQAWGRQSLGDAEEQQRRTEEEDPRGLGLGVAIEKFKPEIEVWLDLEVVLTKSDEIGKG